MKNLPSPSRLAALFAIALSAGSIAHAQTVIVFPPVTVVDGGTPGFYNASLGTILDGTAPQFPLPLGAGGGDPLIYPSAEPNIAAATNILGSWLTPLSTLNANWQQLATIPATWAGNTETAIIYEINGGTHGITNLIGDFDADNGLFVWVNGQFKFGARGPGLPSPAGQFEYTNVFLGNLLPGTNRIQILREDNFDATGYQVRIMGNPLGGDLPPQPCVSAPAGLVSWWRAEANGFDSIGTNTGIFPYGIAYNNGVAGQAFDFDGSQRRVSIADSPAFQLTNAMTLEAWVYPRAYGGFITFRGDNRGGLDTWTLDTYQTGFVNFQIDDEANNYASVLAPIALNQWQHVAATWDRTSGSMKIYINGSLVQQTNTSIVPVGVLDPSSEPAIGIGNHGGTFHQFPFNGLIDELGIFSRALTAAEIQSIHAAGSGGKCAVVNPPVVNCTPTPAGLVSWWRAENNTTDAQGTNHGALAGGITYAAGEVGQAFSFNNALAAAVVPSSPSLNVGSGAGLTLEAWIKPADVTQAYPLFEWNDSTYWGVHFYIAPGQPTSGSSGPAGPGQLYANVVDSSGGWHQLGSAAGVVAANTFQHVALTYDKASGLATIYRNGEVVSQLNIGSFSPLTTYDLYLGRRQAPVAEAGSFSGLMDEPAVYNRALSQTEVQTIYNAANSGKCIVNPPAVNCTPVPPGAFAWWQAETNTYNSIDGGSGIFASPSYNEGKVGTAFDFNGANNVVIPDQPSFNPTNALTIECWVYPRALTTSYAQDLVSKDGEFSGPRQYMLTMGPPPGLDNGTGGFRAHVGVPGGFFYFIDGATKAQLDTWYHVAMTYDGAMLKLFVNGNLDAQLAVTVPIITSSEPIRLGGGAPGNDPAYYFNGRLDEVALYGRALSQSEIQSIYNASGNGKCATNPPMVNCTTAPSGLVSWWPGNQNTLDIVSGNNGNLGGNSTYDTGVAGSGFSFDGDTDGVNLGNPPSLQLQNFTIESWIKRGSATICSLDQVLGPGGVMLSYGFGGYGFGVFDSGELFLTEIGIGHVRSTLLIADTNYHHVAVTKSGGAVTFYVDGVLDSVVNYNPTFQFVTEAAIGAVSSDRRNSFLGRVDELSIYNRALTAGEIASIYNASAAGKCPLPPPPLIAQHPTNQTVNANTTAQFTVAATGSPTLRYQWFFGGNPLPNQTNTSLTIANALPINEGLYRVTVSNDFGFAISSNALLTVLTFPPVITRQPTNVTVIVGSAATFSVQATGSVALAYQWLSNGIPMAGRTSTSLAFQSAQFSNAANYSVIVSNPYGAVTSSVAVLTVNPIPPCAPAHDGLVSWWKGENNALDNWDSNNGSIAFGTGAVAGKVGLAWRFPLVSVNDSPSLRVTNGLTLETWINPTSLTGVRAIVTKFEYPPLQPNGTQSAYLLGTTNNGTLFFTLTPNGSVRTNTTLVTTNLIPLNQWTHVAATYDGSVMRLYINGTQIGQTNHSGKIFPGSAPLGIGGFAGPSFQTSSPWQYSGLVDEVSLYNRALSAAEIQSIVAADLTGKCLAPPVITQQPLDQIVPLGEDVKFTVGVSGSRPLTYQWYISRPRSVDRLIGATNASLVIEKVTTNNAAFYFVTVSNSVGTNISTLAQLSTIPAPSCVDVLPGLISWWPADGTFSDAMGLNNAASYSPGTYPTGKVGSAFTFNGINSRVSINTTTLNFTNNQNFSVEMWIKATITNSTYANVPLLEKFDGFRGYSLSLFNGRLAFALGGQTASGATSSRLFASSGADLRDAFFHHVAVTIDRTNSNGGVLYVDGAPILVFDPRTYTNSLLNQLPLYIGGPFTTTTNSNFSGLIDEPAIYNRALTAAEILSIRTAGAAGRCKSKPLILTQPVGGSVQLGSNFTMSVTASGTPLLRYQWRQNGVPVNGSTNSSLTLSNAFNSLAGTYSVIVSNAFGSVISSNAIVVISNRPPTAVSGSFAVNEDAPMEILLTGTDPEQNPLTYSVVTQPTNGILSGSPASRFRIYIPFQNYNGPDFFTYKVNDGFSDSAIATMSITVRPVNDAPIAFSEEFAMDEDTALPIQLRADDVDDAELLFEIVQQPAHGTLTGSGAKRFYTPAQDYSGDDYFTFIARDGSNAVSQIAAVSITIRPVNDAPVARIVITPLDQMPGETNTVLISPACCDTTLVLDGSQSSDVENTPLTYIWMDGTNVIATTATFTNQFAPGVHELALIVSDGELTGTELLTVEILKTEDAVLHLQTLVQTSSLARNEKAALVNWLKVTIKALEDCNADKAVMFLERFEARVAERISVINAKDAERWITISQAIREVAGLCDPADRPCHDKDKGDDKGQPKHEKSDEEKSGGDRSGRENSKTEKATAKSEQENRGERGNSDDVRVGKSSPR